MSMVTNIRASQYTSNKGFAEDLSEGKFSFPVVHGIQADKSNRQVLSTSLDSGTMLALTLHL